MINIYILLKNLLMFTFSISFPAHAADTFVGLKMELYNPKN